MDKPHDEKGGEMARTKTIRQKQYLSIEKKTKQLNE